MLEPYQPAYRETFSNSIHSLHPPKPSRMNTCTSATMPAHMHSTESRTSLMCDLDRNLRRDSRLVGSGYLYQCASGTTYHNPAYRPRQNSVFVGSLQYRDSLTPEPQMPRKTKSAEDLKSLVVQVTDYNMPSTSTSVIWSQLIPAPDHRPRHRFIDQSNRSLINHSIDRHFISRLTILFDIIHTFCCIYINTFYTFTSNKYYLMYYITNINTFQSIWTTLMNIDCHIVLELRSQLILKSF